MNIGRARSRSIAESLQMLVSLAPPAPATVPDTQPQAQCLMNIGRACRHSGAESLHLLVALALPVSSTLPDAKVAMRASESILAALNLLDVLARRPTGMRVVKGADAWHILWQLQLWQAGVLGPEAGSFRAGIG